MLASLDVGFGHMGIALFYQQEVHDVKRMEFPKTKIKKVRASSDRIDRSQRYATALYEYFLENDVHAVIGELPHGGSKNMNAAVEMNCGTVLCGAVCALMELPCEWCSPNDVKKEMCGKISASKQEIIDAVMVWRPKLINVEVKGNGTIYHVKTKGGIVSFPKTKFDDVSDALAVYKTMQTSNMVRMFG